MDRTDKNTLVNNSGVRSKWAAPLLLIALAGVILGAFPNNQAFWAKCWIAEWSLLVFVALVFVKDKWLKAFLIICLINFIRTFTLGGIYKGTAFLAFYYIFLFLMIYQILLNKLTKKDTKLIVNGICIIILIQLAYMYLQYFRVDPIFKLGEPYLSGIGGVTLSTSNLVTASWGHTNISGASLAITLPLFFRRKWWIAAPFIVFMIVSTESLGAVVAAACGGIFYLLFVKKLFTSRWLVLFIIALAVFSYGKLIDPRQFSLKTDRLIYLKSTLKIIKQHPIIGYGLGQYKIAFPQISKYVFKKNTKTTHAHFDFAELTVDLGAIGAIVILGFIIGLFCHFFKNMTNISLVAMSGIVAGLVNSCSTFVFHTPLAWIILVLMVMVKKEVKNVD